VSQVDKYFNALLTDYTNGSNNDLKLIMGPNQRGKGKLML
jgi:hypothetical protein